MGVMRRVGGPTGDPRRAAREGAERGVYLAGEHLLTESRANAPIDEGTLRGTGAVYHDGLTATVGFDGPYAARQHEELDWHHPRGGQAKYLEEPMQTEQPVIRSLIAQAIRSRLAQ
ncbi:hypothetical protein [Serinicoccus sediminis]|uniref:hypothetical protein n=1 Tax=Serinicoccus sediminis TaxID=2306021 RepID=UPI00192DE20E|nr:hypothetical protein [Serinicoccus sediminis]